MKLYIARHTSVDVPQGTCYGHTDVPLRNTFNEEAEAVKQKLDGLHFDKVYTSPLSRCIRLASFCGFEWRALNSYLSESYTVYTIDLLGCGRSEKPNLTYTNYLYVQLIADFIKSEIGHRTNVIASGTSSSIAIMACSNSPELFDQMLFINPESVHSSGLYPGKNAKLYKLILDMPVIGTLIYNISCSRNTIKKDFLSKYFSGKVPVIVAGTWPPTTSRGEGVTVK